MSKLKKLLAKQAALTSEVNTVTLFVDRVHGKGTLVMTAVGDDDSDGIVFTPQDLNLELQVLDPINKYLAGINKDLAKVNRKIAAIEELMA